ncbi:MAG: hypothetical protein AAGA02_04810 [Bacteroidota bacterium]
MEEAEDKSDFRDMLIWIKGMELFDLASKIADLIDDEDEILSEYKRFLLEDASMISTKIAGAEGADIYDIRMECAAIVRKCVRPRAGDPLFGFGNLRF